MFSINIISVKTLMPCLHTLKYVFDSKFLKNVSDYQGAWLPLVYNTLLYTSETCLILLTPNSIVSVPFTFKFIYL